MLSNVSWSEYGTTILLATIIYYLLIWLIIYKGKVSLLASIANVRNISVHAEDPDETIATAQHVIDDLRQLFIRDANKNELLYALQLKLQKYNQWNEHGFRDTINQYILNECQTKCSIRLSEDDQRALWK